MRNLKRALSLALASVMLMGMMVVGSSAASYPDVDDQDHVEAIEVLSAVGVIVGDNGNFRPDDSVSRNEMAVIMAKLILGTYEADSYVGNHPFTDVPDWASKYVAACYNSGIIAGRTETTYDGTATVTAVEAAAMMLRALGYEDLSKGAAQWDQPVAAKANEINLFVGLNGAGNAAMNRDGVAQLALNTIQATMVTTVRTGQDITLPDGTTISGTRRYDLRTTNYGWQDAIDDEGNGTYGYLQLGEYLYRGDLKRETDEADDFGRPATKWLYNSSEVIAAVEEADATYTKEVKVKDLYKDLGLGKQTTATRTTDGVDAGTVTLTRTSDTKLGGNGVLIQAFKDKDGNVSIVEINTYLVRATADYNTKDEKLSVMPYGVTLTNSKIANEDVAVSEFEKDDLILVTGVKNESGKLEVKTAELAVLEEDVKVSAYNGTKDYVTAGGTKYSYNKNAAYDPDSAIDHYNLQKTTYTLVLDKYDYVMGVKKFGDEITLDDMLFVKEADKVGFNYQAKVQFMDGTTDTVVVAATAAAGDSDYTDVTGVNDSFSAGKITKGKFYEFNKKSNGEYELRIVADNRQGKQAGGAAGDKIIDGGKVNPIATAWSANVPTTYLAKAANDNTVFIADGEVYTGLKNAPDVTATNKFASEFVYYLLDKDSNYILAVYTDLSGVSVSSTSEYVYILEAKGSGKDDDGKTYNIYTAIVDGEKVTYEAKGASKPAGLYEVRSTEDGYPKLETAIASGLNTDQMYTLFGVGKSSISYKSGVVNAGKGLKVNEDTVVYVVDVADKSANIMDASAVDGIDVGTYSVYAIFTSKSDSTVKTLWLAKTSDSNTVGSSTAASIKEELAKGPVIVTGEITGNLTVGDGEKLTLDTNGSVGSGSVVTVASGATLEVKGDKSAAANTIKLDGGTLEVNVAGTKLPALAAGSTGTLKLAEGENVMAVIPAQSAAISGGYATLIEGAAGQTVAAAAGGVMIVGDGKFNGNVTEGINQYSQGKDRYIYAFKLPNAGSEIKAGNDGSNVTVKYLDAAGKEVCAAGGSNVTGSATTIFRQISTDVKTVKVNYTLNDNDTAVELTFTLK